MQSARTNVGAALLVAFAFTSSPPAAMAAKFKVGPGESIQAAVDAAAPGDTVIVFPGDYVETHGGKAAVRITKPLKLLAKSKLPDVKVRILPDPDNPGQTDGILVEPENEGDPDIEGIKIKGFTVEGFANNGIWLRHVNKFKIQKNESINNLENGIWPTLSTNGLVKQNVSYGSLDSALWVEASENIRVLKNELFQSPTGLEITVSKNVVAKKNDIHDNSVGIGLYHPNAAGLPPLGDDGDWDISGNDVYDNNEPNGAPPGSFSAALPPGIGILVLGVDRIEVKKNTVENNDFIGVAVVDWCIGAGLADPGSGISCDSNPPIVESAPDNVEVTKNTVTGNGTAPPSGFEGLESDLAILAGEGTNNCFERNTPTATTFPPTGLPECN